MTDLQFLFVIIILFYFVECFHTLPKGSTSFSAGFLKKRCKIQTFNSLLRLKKGWLVFSSPLPPFGKFFVVNELPVTFAKDGFYTSSKRDCDFVAYTSIKEIKTKQSTLKINESISIQFGSFTQASAMASLLTALKKASGTKREKILKKFLKSRYEIKLLQENLETYYDKTHTLRFLCFFLFFFLFIFSPGMIYWRTFEAIAPMLFIEILVISALISISFWFSHRYLVKSQKQERRSILGKNLLCPINSIGCANLLSKSILTKYSPVAVAFELCNEEKFHQFTRQVLQKAKQNAEKEDALTGDILEYELLIDFLKSNKVDLDKLNSLTEEAATDTKSYCPSCQGQYTLESGICADCPGIELIPLEK